MDTHDIRKLIKMKGLQIQYKKPIKVAIVYSVLTLILYLFGPYSFPSINRGLLVLFLFVCNVAMYFGFVKGTQIPKYNGLQKKAINIDKLLQYLFIISLLLAIPKFVIYTGFYSGTIPRTLSSIAMFFAGAADEIYANRQHAGNATGIWIYLNYIVVLFGAFHWAYTPLAIYYWKRLSKFKKVGTLVIWLFYILQYICTGTNVGIFEFFITFFIVKMVKGIATNNVKRSGSKRTIILFTLLIVIILYSFNFVMSSRIGDRTDYLPLGNTTAVLDTSSFIWKIMPDVLKPILAYVTRYLAIPYHALATSFDLPWDSTLGIGYSWFLLDNVPFDLWEDTYMMKLEHFAGYDHWASWHTAYLWFANDVSYFGVPVVLFLLCRIFGRAWATYLQTRNLCALLQFMLFVKMITFISANNQVFQACDHLFAFWILLFLFNKSKQYIWS